MALGVVAGVIEPWSVQLALARTDGGARNQNVISDMDGVFAYSSFGNLTPKSGMCELLATSFQNATGTVQNETGIFSCNGWSIGGADGFCSGGPKKYFEGTDFSSGRTYRKCVEMGAAAGSTNYTMQTYRTGLTFDGSDNMNSYVAGAFGGSISHYFPSDGTPKIWYGLEVAYNGTPFPCDTSWKGSGSWSSIEYRKRSTGAWTTIPTPDTFSSSPPCVTLTTFNSSGAFSASH